MPKLVKFFAIAALVAGAFVMTPDTAAAQHHHGGGGHWHGGGGHWHGSGVGAAVAGDPALSLALARLGAGAAIPIRITRTITIPARAAGGRAWASGAITTGSCAAPGAAGDTAEINKARRVWRAF